MRLQPFFSFYGGKWRMTPKHFPPPKYSQIIEPFAGSAGYALNHSHLDVRLYDLDINIAALWTYLIGVRPAEILSLPDIRFGQHLDDVQLTPEAKLLIGFWLNKGTTSPGKTPSAWMRSGVRPGSAWGERVRHTIAAQVPHIRHWKVTQGNYSCARAHGPATYFIDPPYQKAGIRYRKSARTICFKTLGAWCRDLAGQVIVCEAGGADWLPFQKLADIKTSHKTRRSLESVYIKDSEA